MGISTRNLTARELASVAKKLYDEENSMKIVATLLTVSEFVDGKEKIVNQAIIPHEGGKVVMAKTNYCVYAHINVFNRKVYVGITNNISRRWGKNGSGYISGKYGCFKYAILKYGWDNFEHIILENSLTLKQARVLEKLYIKALDAKVPNGYNLTDGGEGVVGVPFSEEHKRKLSKIRKRKIASGEIVLPSNGKAVVQLTKDGTLVGEYKSATEAQYKCGLGLGTVGKACNGGLKTLGGYIWKWREEYGTH